MALGQGIHDILNYKDIAEAGQPQNLTGEALVQLGALFTQMDFDFKKDKGEDKPRFTKEFLDEKFSIKDEALDKLNPFRNITTELMPGVKKLPELSKLIPRPKITPKPIITDPKRDKNALYIGRDVLNLGGTGLKDTKITGNQESSTPGNEILSEQAIEENRLEVQKGFSQEQTSGIDASTDILFPSTIPVVKGKGIGRLKDDNPIKRLQQEHPQILETLQGLRYKQPSEVDSPLFRAAHIASSPFVKTDEVDYRYMKRATMPEYAKGSLGSAAAEGYNLVIDKRNYDQAVKKDYETELDDEMGDLNIKADTINEQTRKDYLELSMNKKKKFNSLFQAYANNEISKLDFENGKAALVSELDAVAGAQTNLTKLRADYLENKGTYHIDASKPEIVDFYNTLEKNPESFTMRTIDGIDYFIGSTRQGKEVKVPTSKIANGTAGFRLVEKASVTPVVASALKAVGSYSEEGMTDYGFGRKSATPERAKEIGMANIKNALAQDESKLRSFMASIYGVNHETYKNFIGNDPTANREEMLNDAAEHLYETQVKPQFFPTQKTSRIDPSKVKFATSGGGSSTAGERTAAEIQKQINSFSPPTRENIISDWSTIIDKTKYKVQKDVNDGKYYITDLKDNLLSEAFDFSKPNDIANMFANIAGIKGKQKLPYSLPK
tara:strand:+ start:6933 stop:8933 length:2001 start_codon:yes stop_codon:yes gene_type:complete